MTEPWKNLFWNEQKNGRNREILHKAVYVHKRNLLSLIQWLFSLELHPDCRKILYKRRNLVFLKSFFFFNIKAKLSQSEFYHTYCHINTWSHLILLSYCSQLRFYYVKLFGTLEKDCKVKEIHCDGKIIGICKFTCRLKWWRWRYLWTRNRSSHQRCSVKKGVLSNFAKFTGKHLC